MNKNEISLQVYTARNFKPYEDIFKFLSDSGLENVELFEVEAFDETKDLLEKYNLTAKSSHIGFDTLKDTKEIISSLQKINGRKIGSLCFTCLSFTRKKHRSRKNPRGT